VLSGTSSQRCSKTRNNSWSCCMFLSSLSCAASYPSTWTKPLTLFTNVLKPKKEREVFFWMGFFSWGSWNTKWTPIHRCTSWAYWCWSALWTKISLWSMWTRTWCLYWQYWCCILSVGCRFFGSLGWIGSLETLISFGFRLWRTTHSWCWSLFRSTSLWTQKGKSMRTF